jgi:hypothetical protein
MRENTPLTPIVRVQPPEDLIDFPISDTFRDHFAAQGLSYPSGRYPRRPGQQPQRRPVENSEHLDVIRSERDGWKSRAPHLQAQLAKLEEELKRHQEKHPSQGADRYRGVDLDACA